jgi:hypothetical protein
MPQSWSRASCGSEMTSKCWTKCEFQAIEALINRMMARAPQVGVAAGQRSGQGQLGY